MRAGEFRNLFREKSELLAGRNLPVAFVKKNLEQPASYEETAEKVGKKNVVRPENKQHKQSLGPKIFVL